MMFEVINPVKSKGQVQDVVKYTIKVTHTDTLMNLYRESMLKENLKF
jgi:hypothetical protein